MGVVMVCEELVHYSPSMEQLHDLSEDDIITYGPSSIQTATVIMEIYCCAVNLKLNFSVVPTDPSP